MTYGHLRPELRGSTNEDKVTKPHKEKVAAKVAKALKDKGLLPDPGSTGPMPVVNTSDASPGNPVHQQTTPGRCTGCSRPIYSHADDCAVVNPRDDEQEDPAGLGHVVKSALGAFGIELSRTAREVTGIVLTSSPLTIIKMDASTWDASWTKVDGYPVSRAAKLLIGYSQDLGAYADALNALGRLTKLHPMEKETAVTVQTATPKTTTTKTPKAAKEKPAAKPAKETKASKAAAAPVKTGKDIKAAAKASKEAGEKKPTSAARFRELLKEGGKVCKHTDDEIFAIVKKEFNLDDKKRSYVAWYRNDLKKRGETVPEAKIAKE